MDYLASNSSTDKATSETIIFQTSLGRVPGSYTTQDSKKAQCNTAVPVG
jgi:hypothetical protein